MLGTILSAVRYVYYLLFINTFYLYKLDVSKKNFLLNSQNNNTTIFGSSQAQAISTLAVRSYASYASYALIDNGSSDKMNIQSAENCKEFSETVRQLPDNEDYKF